MSEVTSSEDVKVVPVPPSMLPGAYATTTCGSPTTIQIRDTLSGTFLEHISRHEMGHAIKMNHTGDDDSFGGPLETMAPCTAYNATSLSQDDDGHVTHHHGDLSPETIHANAGFESSTSWWGTSSVASFYTSTYLPEDGSAAARFLPSANDGYVYQTMNYASAGQKYVDARMNYRKVISNSTTGRVRLELLRRHVLYNSGGCSQQFLTGKDQNSRQYTSSWWVAKSVEGTPSSSWQMKTTSTYRISGSYDANDLRVRVKSNVRYTSSGGLAVIGLDTTRARDRS